MGLKYNSHLGFVFWFGIGEDLSFIIIFWCIILLDTNSWTIEHVAIILLILILPLDLHEKVEIQNLQGLRDTGG